MNTLPSDIVADILILLKVPDLRHIALTCKDNNSLIVGNSVFWRRFYVKIFGNVELYPPKIQKTLLAERPIVLSNLNQLGIEPKSVTKTSKTKSSQISLGDISPLWMQLSGAEVKRVETHDETSKTITNGKFNIVERPVPVREPERLPELPQDIEPLIKFQRVYQVFVDQTNEIVNNACPIDSEFLRREVLFRKVIEKLIEIIRSGLLSRPYDVSRVKQDIFKIVMPLNIDYEQRWDYSGLTSLFSTYFKTIVECIMRIKDRFTR